MMRFAAGLGFSLLMLPAATTPARGESPFFVGVSAGLGTGGGQRDGSATRGPFGIWAADLAWRHRPGRAIVLSLETAGGPFFVSRKLASASAPPNVDSIEHQSIVLGIERSLPDAGVGPYVQFGAGLGRVTTDSFERSKGLALSGAAGLRIVPRPGPVGFLIGFRTNHVISTRARCGALAMTLGLTIHPR